MTDRHHCSKPSNIHKTVGGQILLKPCSSLMISVKFNLHKKMFCWSRRILQGACPCIPPATLFYREHDLSYPQPHYFTGSVPFLTPNHSILQEACPYLPPTTLFYRERALTYPQPHYFTGSVPFLTPQPLYFTGCVTFLTPNHAILQGVCPFLPPTTLFYRERAYAYP